MIASPVRGPLTLAVGPMRFRLDCRLAEVRRDFLALYRDYPIAGAESLAQFCVDIGPTRWWRRFIRPEVIADPDVRAPFVPMPRLHGLICTEMALNWLTAMGPGQHLVLHAASVARSGHSIIMPGQSGSGKSTLAAGLGFMDWQFVSDEFVLLNPTDGLHHPYPRPASLKNESLEAVRQLAPSDYFSASYANTQKGTITYVRPLAAAIAAMHDCLTPTLIVFPRFSPDESASLSPITPSESFVRIVSGSANYEKLRDAAFLTLSELVMRCPNYILTYSNFTEADALLGAELARHA